MGDVIQLASHRRAAEARPVDATSVERIVAAQAALELASRGLVVGLSSLLARCRHLDDGGPAAVATALGTIDLRLAELRRTRRQARRIVALIETGDLAGCLALRDQLRVEPAGARS
ncbi:MAG: hypothetical protein HY060_22300 [Proteobacteria bacterium]|nr:hypothetical protein [Pseudomonadota bacterium]